MFESFKAARVLRDLEERMSTCERQLNGLKIELAEMLDRMTRVMKRLGGLYRAEQKARDTPDTGNLSDEDIANGATTLSDRQRSANAAILARRNRSPQ